MNQGNRTLPSDYQNVIFFAIKYLIMGTVSWLA